MSLEPFRPAALDSRVVTERRTRIATALLLLVAPAALLMADLHWRTGFDAWKTAHLVLFAILFAHLAFGAVQAATGFIMRRKGGDPCRIIRTIDLDDTSVLAVPTAVVMPICNEDVGRIMEGMRVIYESVAATGQLANCDFFLLSDSPDPNQWVREESAWLALTQELGAEGRLFYRKRRSGTNKKAGNIADFCRRWGSHYRYMVVLDADSIITGEAVARLVRLMESNPRVGLIQAVPMLVNGETILARVQQFAGRLYGPVFSTGLNYWQLGEANYWGHNAIIRIRPFIRHCSLPELSGDGPFGGRILSHDYVEAALMRRAGWQVWLATDLPGNYEECPANLVEFAKRDRRWLQGNLQHASLIFARGFHAVNRVHFILGILSYLASPLWLAFIGVSLVIAHRAAVSGAMTGRGSGLPWTYSAQALGLLVATLVLLFLPKVLALIDLRRRPEEMAAFGGKGKLALGILAETGIFTLIAPVLMLFHTKFVILTLARQSITWGAQRRGRAGESAWRETVATHAGQTFFGIALAVLAVRTSPAIACWMSPVLAGLILSIPISYLTGGAELGLRWRQHGIFNTPEEQRPTPELQQLAVALGAERTAKTPAPELVSDYGLLQAVLDPYVNAAHVSFLREKKEAPPAIEQRLAELREKLLRDGPAALTPQDRMALLSDLDSMVTLHEAVWSTRSAQLSRWWQLALDHYHVMSALPETAFVR